MTARVVRWHEMLPSSSGELVPAVGGYRFTPTRARIISGDPDIEVLPESFVEPLVDGKLDVALEQTGVTWVWRVERNVHHLPKTIEYVAVPAGLDPIDQTDLIRIDPETLVPDDDLTPMWFAITSIVERNVTIIGNERILAETARDEATLAKDNAELAELSSETAQSLAEAALAAAIIAQNGSEHARDEALIAENNTNVLAVDALASADSANTSAINASNSALAASESKQAAQTAQSIAEIARAGAELAETGAEIAQTAAQTARTGAETAQGAASGYATTASQQAGIAMDQAVLAAGSASDAADAETAAQTAQGLAEGARDAAEGARDAAQTAKGLAETARDAAALSASDADADRLAAQTAKGLAETARDAAALSANSAAATLAGAVTKATVDAKGDLLVGSANDAVTRLPVGSDGSILVPDSNAATGLGYQSPIPLLKNLVVNGDFSNGTTGWAASNASMYTASGRLFITASAQWGGSGQYMTGLTIGNRYYYAGTIDGTATNCINVSNPNTSAYASGTGAQRLSIVFTATTANANFNALDRATSAWTGFYFDNAIVINLTACFGAGNEPSKAEMDAFMETGGWFAKETPKLLPTYGWNKLTQGAAKNPVVNGDFSNGTTGWTGSASTISASNNVLTVTASGTTRWAGMNHSLAELAANRKYYFSASVKQLDAPLTSTATISVSLGGTVSVLVVNPSIETLYSASTIMDSSAITTTLNPYTRYNSDTPSDYIGKRTEWRKLLLLDLTTIFGAGNEPTKTEMDHLLSKYPNGWFDGIVNDLKTNYDPMRRIGKGSPYNVITPRKAGETWTDLDQTCGARVWTSTGLTTTSWVVTDGDTGWRDVSSTLVNGWTGAVHIRRSTVAGVELAFEGLDAASATTPAFMPVPTGFSTSSVFPIRHLVYTTTPTLRRLVSAGSNYTVIGFSIIDKYYSRLTLGEAAGTWPATLPGTAA